MNGTLSSSKRAPRSPGSLKAEGKRLWRDVVGDYDLDEHELALLRAACRTVDRLEDVAVALETSELTANNARGDLVAHPLLVEQRMQGIALARLLASLRLPTGDDADGELSRPQRRGGARGAYGLRSVTS